jgi:transposase
VARIKQDLCTWRLGRCLFVGDAGLYSADNLAALSRGLGRYILAVPMRKLKDIELEVLTRPGRYKQVADNLQVKEVSVGDGEPRKRYVLCLNPHEAERERARRTQLLRQLDAELTLLDSRDEDHPKAACALIASRRYGRYLRADWRGRPQLDSAKIKAAEKFDGKFVVIRDDTLSAEDIALGYKGAWIIESCFRRMKQTGLEVRPMFHWTPRRIDAHVKLCVLALRMQRAAESQRQPDYCSAHQNHPRAGRHAEKARHINAQADPQHRRAYPSGRTSIDTRPESASRKPLINRPKSSRLPSHREHEPVGQACGQRQRRPGLRQGIHRRPSPTP